MVFAAYLRLKLKEKGYVRTLGKLVLALGWFNCPINFEERIGRPIGLGEIDLFRECAQYCELKDMNQIGYCSSSFQWSVGPRSA